MAQFTSEELMQLEGEVECVVDNHTFQNVKLQMGKLIYEEKVIIQTVAHNQHSVIVCVSCMNEEDKQQVLNNKIFQEYEWVSIA